ncbi:bifunctional phosphoribosyl-AMP cyclohydrolase/phosphoribosyl-ATP diphosphatase HisIE [Pantoea sp. Mhis]|uniref:bifunctional phosphoribosyl-AMP cyclohydrolase/phosphoribosyl-ATP diphosphatase HisIE n=1 Tax=Pantoea sp. Mhis TaxID=2576759 RepID=UPI00135CB4A4|nr:bifunctional phosphoribosyl-AMP cyclohydrolase/phosphoribosyl-ATP diphosphatase HisIE [Pantoea sp. Mhis]MXP56158.1 bifunctional phosphoribosyl-AMP cyclohydrolase/phosphoribosyl-ATP diphosphatase HisIE [Pantoea sp. Mhis]
MLNKEQIIKLDWNKTSGLLPVIVQHYVSGEVLMHAYMNKESLEKSLDEKRLTFFSRTKNRIWTKGETSGFFLKIINVSPDCDNDTLLFMVNPIEGPTCHLKRSSCFVSNTLSHWTFLYQLESLLAKRKISSTTTSSSSSYTAQLYASGIKRIAQKVGEEGLETALAAIINNRQDLINELSDLVYHMLVLMQSQDINLSAIINNLQIRNNKVLSKPTKNTSFK